eukprot:61240_1
MALFHPQTFNIPHGTAEKEKKYYHDADDEEYLFNSIVNDKYNVTEYLKWKNNEIDEKNNNEPDKDDIDIIAICINSLVILVGHKGDDKPSIAIRNEPKDQTNNLKEANHYEAQKVFNGSQHNLKNTNWPSIKNKLSQLAKLKNESRNGMIVNWNEMMPKLNEYICSNRNSDKEFGVLVTTPMVRCYGYEQKLTQEIFRNIDGCSKLYLCQRSLLSLYPFGTSNVTGIVVLSDAHCTEIGICHEGTDYGGNCINLGKRDCLKYLEKNKNNLDDDINGMDILFNPKLCDDPEKQKYDGIHKLIYKNIINCPNEWKKELCGNIILSGPNTLYDGFKDRLEKELKLLTDWDDVSVIAHKDREELVWNGSAVFMEWLTNDSVEWVVNEY